MSENLVDLKNKRVTVMGLGLNRGGLGVARFLAKSGAQVLVTDLKTECELKDTIDKLKDFTNIQFVLGEHRKEDFIRTDMVIQNPAVPRNSKYLQIAKTCGIPIETDLSLFLRICPSTDLIAVAGTKGKSTVTNLIYHTFSQAKKDIVHAGNIGISVFDVLPEIKPDTIVLLEISSWQLEGLEQARIRLQPNIAILTNILADHLDRYDSFDDYAISEKLIYKYQDQSNCLITNMDNHITKNVLHETRANIYWYSTENEVSRGSYLKDNKLFFKSDTQLIEFYNTRDIPLSGLHNVSNVLAASNVFFIYNLPIQSIQNGIKSFPGIANRLEKIRSLNGIHFYNDTCATTPDATIAAIQSFGTESLILILGGGDKKLNYKGLGELIENRKNIIHIIVLQHTEYSASELILEQLRRLKLDDKTEICFSMADAVNIAYKKAVPGTKIVLSPAATSFGLFVNEFDRGDCFRQAVNKLF